MHFIHSFTFTEHLPCASIDQALGIKRGTGHDSHLGGFPRLVGMPVRGEVMALI